MRPAFRGTSTRLTKRLATVVLAAATLSLLIAAAASAAAPAPWHLTVRPWSEAAVNDIAAAEPSFLAAAGPQGRVAVSHTGGVSWTLHSPADSGFVADLEGIAFGSVTQGVVAGAAGTLLVTADGGYTWGVPPITGTPPTADLNDVALAGTRGAAVGDGGTVLESTTAGVTWRVLARPTTADLTCVAVAEDGTMVAGADNGLVYVRRGTTWTTANVGGPVTAVAARLSPSGSASPMRFVASTGYEVFGSDDGVAFSTLLSAVYASAPPWPALAWSHLPGDELLVAGPDGSASFFAVAPATWTTGATALADPRTVTATPAQSVAYVLGSDGRIARTFSSGRAPANLVPATKTITAGQSVTLGSLVRVGAPGEIVAERRIPGGTWRIVRRLAWTSADRQRALEIGFSPTLTTDYRLRFMYGGLGRLVSPTSRVTVKPRLTPEKLRIAVSRGTAYRFKGKVFPTLRGEKVRLYTDRGGEWHQIGIGGIVKLRDGVRWRSRLFGTPTRETYHLRARIDATTRHAASWSAVVTVVVR